ncbi:hypothetical protein FRC02_005501, partial [Tulasnella sp. 418]
MRAPLTITREEFKQAANALLTKNRNTSELEALVFDGWVWHDHPSWPNLGYMLRSTFAFEGASGSQMELEDFSEDVIDAPMVDEAEATTNTQHGVVHVEQHVVWSASFQVPALYFRVLDHNGSPLPIERVVKSSLFRAARCAVDWTSIH